MKNIDWQDALKTLADTLPDATQEENETIISEKEEIKQPRLDIILEKKGRAGKTATIICGFMISDDEVADIASKIKSKLGTGGSARGGEILIQGDRRKEVLKLLEGLGFKARII